MTDGKKTWGRIQWVGADGRWMKHDWFEHSLFTARFMDHDWVPWGSDASELRDTSSPEASPVQPERRPSIATAWSPASA